MLTDALPRTRLCRLCLAFTNTYVDIVENEEVLVMLTALTSVRVESNDRISTKMCFKCGLNLRLAHRIQQNMIQAEERFYSLQIQPQEKEEYQIKTEIIEIENTDILEVEQSEVTIKIENHNQQEEKTVKDISDFPCEVCEKNFPNKRMLTRHKYYHKRTVCKICSKEITTSNMHTHMEIHNSAPKVICHICGASLKTKANLKQHIFFSHNAARYKCEYCDQVFVNKNTLEKHRNKEHLGKADFVCETCGKKFYTNKNLQKHIKMTHLKLRPYVCEFCNSGFSSRFALKTHKRQHTNETPYRCEICGEGFRQNVSLKSHKKSKHKITEKKTCHCTLCGKGFASKGALYTHQRIH